MHLPLVSGNNTTCVFRLYLSNKFSWGHHFYLKEQMNRVILFQQNPIKTLKSKKWALFTDRICRECCALTKVLFDAVQIRVPTT